MLLIATSISKCLHVPGSILGNIYLFVYLFTYMYVCMCSQQCPWTLDPPASTSQVLELQAFSSTPNFETLKRKWIIHCNPHNSPEVCGISPILLVEKTGSGRLSACIISRKGRIWTQEVWLLALCPPCLLCSNLRSRLVPLYSVFWVKYLTIVSCSCYNTLPLFHPG